jgi:hypothetical protein
MTRQALYQVGATIAQDTLDRTRHGYVASVTHGHPNVQNLFAFGPHRHDARVQLAKTVVEALDGVGYDLTGKTGIALVIPTTYVYSLDTLGVLPKGRN